MNVVRRVNLLSGGSLHIDVCRLDDGSIVFEGEDLDYALASPGEDREYEYWITVRPEHRGALCAALGQPAGCDPMDLFAASGGVLPDGRRLVEVGEYSWLKQVGVEFEFSSYR